MGEKILVYTYTTLIKEIFLVVLNIKGGITPTKARCNNWTRCTLNSLFHCLSAGNRQCSRSKTCIYIQLLYVCAHMNRR